MMMSSWCTESNIGIMGGGIKNFPLNIVIIITIIMIMSSLCTGSNVGIMGGGSKNFSTCSLSAMHATLQPIVRSRYIYWHLIYWDCPMYPKVMWFFNQLSSWFGFIHLFKNSTEKLKEIFQTRRELLFHSGPVKPWKGEFSWLLSTGHYLLCHPGHCEQRWPWVGWSGLPSFATGGGSSLRGQPRPTPGVNVRVMMMVVIKSPWWWWWWWWKWQ